MKKIHYFLKWETADGLRCSESSTQVMWEDYSKRDHVKRSVRPYYPKPLLLEKDHWEKEELEMPQPRRYQVIEMYDEQKINSTSRFLVLKEGGVPVYKKELKRA